jgi:hypothetical protein
MVNSGGAVGSLAPNDGLGHLMSPDLSQPHVARTGRLAVSCGVGEVDPLVRRSLRVPSELT